MMLFYNQSPPEDKIPKPLNFIFSIVDSYYNTGNFFRRDQIKFV